MDSNAATSSNVNLISRDGVGPSVVPSNIEEILAVWSRLHEAERSALLAIAKGMCGQGRRK